MPGHFFGATLVLLTLVLSACGGGSSAPPPADPEALAAEAPYTLAANDQIRVTIFGHEDLSGEYELDGAGNFPMPLIGDVEAFGLTPNQLQQQIAQVYLEQEILKQAQVTVEVLTFRPFSILGEVRNAGQYEYESGMTVLTAIAMAGGFTYRANQEDFVLQRGGSEVSVGPTTRIRPGDVVKVQERWF